MTFHIRSLKLQSLKEDEIRERNDDDDDDDEIYVIFACE